jgi:hypothetical protein
MGRFNLVLMMIGKKHTGKTSRALALAYKQKKRIIVVDKSKHPRYIEEGFIYITTIAELLQHRDTDDKLYIVYRTPSTVMEVLMAQFSNAFIIFEDSARYLPEEIKNGSIEHAFIADSRKWNFDVVYMFHFLKEIPDYLVKNYDMMVLFKTGDPLDVKLHRFPNWHTISDKGTKVKRSTNEHEYCIIKVDE